MEWYRIEIPQTDNDNFTTEVTIGSDNMVLEFKRIESKLFNDRKWRLWVTFNQEETRQASLFGVSWLEYDKYAFVVQRNIKYPQPSELQQAFVIFIGIEGESDVG